MFEKRRLDRIRVEILEGIAARCDGEFRGDSYPCVFGLAAAQAAGSIVTVGTLLFDGVIDYPPVPDDHRKAERKRIIRALDVDRGVDASVFFAHALVRWCLVRDEYASKTGEGLTPSEHDELNLRLLEKHFPVSGESRRVLDNDAPASFRDLDLTPATWVSLQAELALAGDDSYKPVHTSGWLSYLEDPSHADLAGEGETREKRIEDLRDRHFWVAANWYRATAARHGLRLAMGDSFEETWSAGSHLSDQYTGAAVAGHIGLGEMWSMGERNYYEQQNTMLEMVRESQLPE